MPAHITIRDGSPYWWASTDIWVVPGRDPNGPPGTPVAGQPAYLWAHAANTGNVAANGTRIDFYWADPSAQVVVGTANAIGSAFVDLDIDAAGQDVLCLVPWVPVIVNGGHECLLAVAHGPGDSAPIPDPLPNGYAFDPPAHDQAAQRNITVLMANMLAAAMVIGVRALPREDKQALLTVEYGGELGERQLQLLGLHKLGLKPARERAVDVVLSLEPLCGGQRRDGGHGQHGGHGRGTDDDQGGWDGRGTDHGQSGGDGTGGDGVAGERGSFASGNLQPRAAGEGTLAASAATVAAVFSGTTSAAPGGAASAMPAQDPADQQQVLSVSVAKRYKAGAENDGDGDGDDGDGNDNDSDSDGMPDGGTRGGDGPRGGEPEGAAGSGRGLRLEVRRGMAAAVYAAFSADGLQPGEYQLVHIVERNKGKVSGGVSYAVVRTGKEKLS